MHIPLLNKTFAVTAFALAATFATAAPEPDLDAIINLWRAPLPTPIPYLAMVIDAHSRPKSTQSDSLGAT